MQSYNETGMNPAVETAPHLPSPKGRRPGWLRHYAGSQCS